MARATTVAITTSVLEWAIDQSGFSLDELAERLGISVPTVEGWLSGDSRPSLTELSALAMKLKRQVAVFLLPRPPRSTLPTVEFRKPSGTDRETLNYQERRAIREAASVQRVLSWIVQELGADSPDLAKYDVDASPGEVASSMRLRLGVSVQEQEQWSSSSVALHEWRGALEALGVCVFMLPLGKDSCRGFSLWDGNAPLVAANTSWNAEARIVTLFHELGHLLTRTSSACNEGKHRRGFSTSDTIERWCERFAAAAILPIDSLRNYLTSRGWRPGRHIEDIDKVRGVARRFKVSLRAATLRMIEAEAATWELYASLPPLLDRRAAGGGGMGRNRAQIRRDQLGGRTVHLFARGLERDVIGQADVLDYLNVGPSAFARML